jgi:polysaccharide export outer membrane protein
MKKNKYPHIKLSIFIVFLIIATSCSSIKHYKYFEDISDTSAVTLIKNIDYKEPKIQIDDILSIYIQTLDPAGANAINVLNNTNGINTNGNVPSPVSGQSNSFGYLVNKAGMIKMPVLGDLHLAGLTTSEARELVTEKAKIYFKDPTVIVRFANFKVTVLGEVSRPGTYTVPNEKVSLLDALGYAGDLTIYGRRDNVLLMRKKDDGSTIAVRLNLNKSDILKSPYYYLQQNDELYIQPSKTRIESSDVSQARNITIITSALTVLIVLLTRIK